MNFEHQLVAITFSDGSPLAVMNFITQGRGDALPRGASRIGSTGWWSRPAADDLIAEKVAQVCADRVVAGWKKVDAVPADRTYRNAWADTAGVVTHDMVKAKELHKDMLRQERVEALLPLDVAFMKAMETGDTKTVTDIAAQKQALRDVTDDPRIDAALTVEDLKAITLESARDAVAATQKG